MGRQTLLPVSRRALTWGLAALLLTAAFGIANTRKAEPSRLKLVPIISDQRLEDIQESPDGTRLLTHDRGFAPRLWEPKSMRLLAVLGGHPVHPIEQAEMSQDGSRIVTVSRDMVRLWDSRSAKVVAEWKGTESFNRAEIAPDNSWVAIGGEKGEIWRAEAKEGSSLLLLGKHTGDAEKGVVVRNMHISEDGTLIGSCTTGSTIAVWDVKGGKLLRELSGAKEGAGWVEISRDSKQLLETGLDGNARLWDIASGTKKHEWEHVIGSKGLMPNTLMAAIFVGKTFDEVLVAGPTGTMTVYSRSSGAQLRKLTGYTRPIREIRKSRDGLKVATYADELYTDTVEPLKIWNVETTKEYPFKRGHYAPTAGEFSPDARFFWVGYEDGSIRRHELETGNIYTETISAVDAFDGLYPIGDSGRFYYKRTEYDRGVWNFCTTFDPNNPGATIRYQLQDPFMGAAPTGRLVIGRAYFKDKEGKDKVSQAVWNISTNKLVWAFWDGCAGLAWGGGEEILGWSDTTVAHFNMAEPAHKANVYEGEKKVVFARMSPDNSWAFVFFRDNTAQLIGLNGNEKKHDLGKTDTPFPAQYAFSTDSKTFAYVEPDGVALIDLASGKREKSIKLQMTEASRRTGSQQFELAFLPGGKSLVLGGRETAIFCDIASGKEKFRAWGRGFARGLDLSRMLSPDGTLYAAASSKQVLLYDTDSGQIRYRLDLTDTVTGMAFANKGKRLIVTDATEQATIWDTTAPVAGEKPSDPPTFRRLGSFVVMRDGAWLAIDTNGRYDASDPSNVSGASYVLEWAGGLEPIEVSQLKSLYYEPGLLAKLLGSNVEPLRSVPDLSTIRLYPEIRLEKSQRNPNRVEVNLKERDGGGIGTVHVLINGKEVMTKDGVGFFNVDVSQYMQYFLPAARLQPGRGNLLQVYATNKKGDLTSRHEVVDMGIPDGLKTPDVNMYGLFVGVGDYVGNKRDLKAPPSDALKLREAIQKTGDRLLPKRVHVTALTTDSKNPDQRPTRKAILAWFDDVSKKATSSDIIVVFFAGHGTSRIGEQRGYFFLTADADPSEVTPAIVGTATITGEDLQKRLAAIPASKQVIILDTCHSGAAATSLLQSDRSVSSDFARAYESIKDGSGTWLLAGAAADQLSYESSNVDHGMLTYSLLEAIDRASADGLRSTNSGELFVDVERWLTYAASRVDSLKNEVGLSGVQRPEFKRSKAGGSFDLGVTRAENRGELGLKPPMPIVIMGTFDQDEEDPLKLEPAIAGALRDSGILKLWTDITKHPNVYRVAGSYVHAQGSATVKLRVVVQKFDSQQTRRTLETIELEGDTKALDELAKAVRAKVEEAIRKLEKG